MLKNDPKVSEIFSKTLDNLLQNDPKLDDISTFEQSLRESIVNASDTAIPKCITASRITPWINEDFLDLLQQRRECKDPTSLKTINKSIRKMRTNLSNAYFSKIENNIKLEAEARQVEEEFRLCKNYSMTTKSDKTLISTENLSEFFEDHFKENSSLIQPEVQTPED